MEQCIFLSAQHITVYYLWQLRICIKNIAGKNVFRENIHILFATIAGQEISVEEQAIIDELSGMAMIFMYEDKRLSKGYASSVRPHIIAAHIHQHPELETQRIFYHDCDIYFRELPPLLQQMEENTWYVSDTASYLDSRYVKRHIGDQNFEYMCSIVGVPAAEVEMQDAHCGGAQYLLKNTSAAFWEKVETDAERIHEFLFTANKTLNLTLALFAEEFTYTKGIQNWCADMWALLWNALFHQYKVRVHPDLNFCWPRNPIAEWEKNYILHNAGVKKEESGTHFFKSNYVHYAPFYESFDFVDRSTCSWIYSRAVKEIQPLETRTPLNDFVVVLDAQKCTSPENFYTVLKYLEKNFDTHIAVIEHGITSVINPDMLPSTVKIFLVNSHHPNLPEELLSGINGLILYDINTVIPVPQLIAAAAIIRSGKAGMVRPYDEVLEIDQLGTTAFSKFLHHDFLFRNRDKFLSSENEDLTGTILLCNDTLLIEDYFTKQHSANALSAYEIPGDGYKLFYV